MNSTPQSLPAPDAAPRAMSSSEMAQFNTDLAIDRTLMAADRSLMAWVRTALSMISFGFTIYKLLEGFEQAGDQLRHPNAPRNMGLFLTGLGTVAMVMGTIEFWTRLKALRQSRELRALQPSFILALIMSLTGLVIFCGICFRFV